MAGDVGRRFRLVFGSRSASAAKQGGDSAAGSTIGSVGTPRQGITDRASRFSPGNFSSREGR